MPSSAGYQPLAQNNPEDGTEDDVGDALLPQPVTTPEHRNRRRSRRTSVDLGKLDHAFKKWTESIAQKMKALGKKKGDDPNVKREISHSVFDPPISYPETRGPIKTLDHKPPMTEEEYQSMVQSIRMAISDGHHPKMISKGSSGSYFARAKSDGKYQTVGVFKPKDEEPYGRLNPKTTKWLHRKLRWIIPFGRACLIPNLSYISEAAASLLDTRLALNIVPKTELVALASPAFFYDWIDRSQAKKGKPLPEKIGSMQYFMHGFQDASEFLRQHPLPDRSISDTYDDSTHRTVNISKRFLGAVKIICGRTGDQLEEDYASDDDEDHQGIYNTPELNENNTFHWTPLLLQEFREELEKLVILDYLMRNTDRGSDNYMIKVCQANHDKPLVDVAPTRSESLQMPLMSELKRERTDGISAPSSSAFALASPPPSMSYDTHAHIHIAAIDNSLSFPHEHPKGWRSYTYGWLFLPVSIIGRPFSIRTRKHFLPLLTSKEWWEETTMQLRKLFALDPGYNASMFRRQLAVVKGQAWNIVQCLKHSDEGPLELTRRTKVLVWDDEHLITAGSTLDKLGGLGPRSSLSPSDNVSSQHKGKRSRQRRSHSIGLPGDFPPPMRRTATDVSGLPRPVSFSSKFPRINPGASGVAVLEHLERLDAVEAGLKRLGDDNRIEEAEEEGSPPSEQAIHTPPLAEGVASTMDMENEDLGDLGMHSPELLAKSLPQLEGSNGLHERWSNEQGDHSGTRSHRSLDWWRSEQEQDSIPVKSVIVEVGGFFLAIIAKVIFQFQRLETVNERSLLSCW